MSRPSCRAYAPRCSSLFAAIPLPSQEASSRAEDFMISDKRKCRIGLAQTESQEDMETFKGLCGWASSQLLTIEVNIRDVSSTRNDF
jgi:hypothetical protein